MVTAESKMIDCVLKNQVVMVPFVRRYFKKRFWRIKDLTHEASISINTVRDSGFLKIFIFDKIGTADSKMND